MGWGGRDGLQKRGVFYCEMPNFEARLTDGLIKCEKRCGSVGMLRHEYIVNGVWKWKGVDFPLFSAN